MTNRLLLALVVVASFALQACVTAGTHKELQSKYDKTNAELNDFKGKYASDESKLHDQELVIKDLESKLGKTSSAKLKLESNVAEMQTALDSLNKQRNETEQRIKEYQSLAAKFKSLRDTGKLTVKIVDGQMVVAMSSDVLFPSGSAKLSKEGMEAIKQTAEVLNTVTNRKFQVEGFTDNVPIKSAQFPSNWELASARALNVVKAMVDEGMPAERVSAASFGETHPVKENDTEEGRKANRRIEIVVVPDLSTLPGYDELQKMAGN